MPGILGKHNGNKLDAVSDAVDDGVYLLPLVSGGGLPYTSPTTVNVLKAKIWDSESEFDSTKDKTAFRQYETACDRVKNVYREQHG
jgi:inositol oxygenase